jgi:hypothetical protein
VIPIPVIISPAFPSPVSESAIVTFPFVAFFLEPATVKVSPVVSFKVGTIVCIIITVAIVSVPCGVAVVSITGELIFIDDGRGTLSVTILAYRSGGVLFLVNYRRRGRRCIIHPADRKAKADMCIYIYL